MLFIAQNSLARAFKADSSLNALAKVCFAKVVRYLGRKLFFFFSFILLSAASIYCINFVCEYALSSEHTVPADLKNTANNIELLTPFFEENRENNSINFNSSQNADTSSTGDISAATSGKAKGKISNRTIDSSAANLKYQKIYIKNQTVLKIDLKTELLTLPKLKIASTDKPQVLIVHTHTTECYMNEERGYYTDSDKTRTTDDSKNIAAVGKVLKDALNQKGIVAIHATEKHDYPEYSGSYGRAEQTIKKYLKKYPTIKVVVDLHRDSVTDEKGNKSALVANINGKKAAQVMLVSGCQSGSVTGFPSWRENFRLAIRLQQTMEVMYPSLSRPILFTERKYNQHLTTGSLLIECGTEANTLEQAKYSAELLANCLASTLNMLKTN